MEALKLFFEEGTPFPERHLMAMLHRDKERIHKQRNQTEEVKEIERKDETRKKLTNIRKHVLGGSIFLWILFVITLVGTILLQLTDGFAEEASGKIPTGCELQGTCRCQDYFIAAYPSYLLLIVTNAILYTRLYFKVQQEIEAGIDNHSSNRDRLIFESFSFVHTLFGGAMIKWFFFSD